MRTRDAEVVFLAETRSWRTYSFYQNTATPCAVALTTVAAWVGGAALLPVWVTAPKGVHFVYDPGTYSLRRRSRVLGHGGKAAQVGGVPGLHVRVHHRLALRRSSPNGAPTNSALALGA